MAVTNKTPITRNIMNACPGTKYIAMLAISYSVVDYVYTRGKGIPLSNMPFYGTVSVGQFTIAMLLGLCHHVIHHNQTVRKSKQEHCRDWCYWDYPLIELDGKTMGIIGPGRIGQQTGKIARAMGMNILAYDEYPNESKKGTAKYVDLNTLCMKSDIITLHYPLFPRTQGIVNKGTIAKMKDGVIILNSSREPLAVEKDLADTLNPGRVFGAGLNVIPTESVKGDNPLLKARNCIITPHIFRAPKKSRQRIIDHAVENMRVYIADSPIHVVG